MKAASLSAGAVPVCFENGSWQFLILRAYSNWDFPKGMVEKNEDPWSAAIREVFEETGISEFSTPVGDAFIETEPYGKGKVARYYIIELEETVPIKLDANPITGIIEHHEYRWLSYQEARKKLVPRTQKVIDWVLTQIIS